MPQRQLKIVHLSTHGPRGGAGKAAWRLHSALCQLGVESRMVSCSGILAAQGGGMVDHRWPHHSEAWDLAAAQTLFVDANRTPMTDTIFSLGKPGPGILADPVVASADVLHLHWVIGLLGIPEIGEILACGKPVVWTFHDQWAFTGGCHYSSGCRGFTSGCNVCPQLQLVSDKLPRAVLADKNSLWKPKGPFTIVTLCQWMRSCIQESLLFAEQDVAYIPNGIDLGVFNPSRREAARQNLGIEPGCFVFLFVSESLRDRRKGYAVLRDAIVKALCDPLFGDAVRARRVLIACVGHEIPLEASPDIVSLGWRERDEELADVFAAADVFLAPSLEDNQPNTIVESLACGTPIIGADSGGITELLQSPHVGRLIRAGDSTALASAIVAAASRPEDYTEMRGHCRAQAEEFYDGPANARAMLLLYQRLAQRSGAASGIDIIAGKQAAYGPAVSEFIHWPHSEIPAGGLAKLGHELEASLGGLHQYLFDVEADRAARLGSIVRMQKQLDEHGLARHHAEARVRQLEEELAGTLKYLAVVEADRAERLRVIERLQSLLDAEPGDIPAPPVTGNAT